MRSLTAIPAAFARAGSQVLSVWYLSRLAGFCVVLTLGVSPGLGYRQPPKKVKGSHPCLMVDHDSGQRHRHRHDAGADGQAVPGVFPGFLRHGEQIWRYGPWPRNQPHVTIQHAYAGRRPAHPQQRQYANSRPTKQPQCVSLPYTGWRSQRHVQQHGPQ
jgi:hypothetical protein